MSDVRPLDVGAMLKALVEGGVEFIIIGGLAVGAHGHPRGTKDVDIVPAPDRGNLARLASVLSELECEVAGTDDLEPDEIVQPDLDGLLDGGSWVLRTKFGNLDVMQYVEPALDYETLSSSSLEDQVFGVRVRFCGYDDLVAMKEHAGRPRDVDDLEELRKIRSES